MLRYYSPMSTETWQYATLLFVDNQEAFWTAGDREERVASPQAEAAVCSLLDRAGAHGWELVGMANWDTNSTRYVFKRRVLD
jgi:hypothetical protein